MGQVMARPTASILSGCLQLPDTDQASSFETLQLFAYGTWATYQGTGPFTPWHIPVFLSLL